ncbi:hypothetical protein AAFF_G00103020 [Aldrovandia affinis]|uniref:Uncharacterized protein n=1 Tax=Aldrovandia affinis TaxID=143900 RepID=A0AAD7RUK5_9TELE|nr:hypothetical protein AAFF_G00103020 [Aldrovandia affinis]
MVVMGDGIHNLTDGLAIGECDLVVLLRAGCCCSVGSQLCWASWACCRARSWGITPLFSPWILPLTAGVLLYVALADMMLEMLHGDMGPVGPLTCFFL